MQAHKARGHRPAQRYMFLPVRQMAGVGVLVLACLIGRFSAGQEPVAPVSLPSGVTVEMAAGLPLGFQAQILTVDWGNPLLKVSVASGLEREGFPAEAWARAEDKDPEALRIQLIEPEQDGDAWRLALPMKAIATAADVPVTPAVAIGSPFPWRVLDASQDDLRQSLLPGPAGGLAVGVRWVGEASGLDSLPDMALDRRVLVSWTSASAGRTRFALVVRTLPSAASLGDLKPWLREQLGPGDLLAIHALGDRAIAGMKDWRMSAPSDPRRIERMGGVLVLSPCHQGDAVDWLRLEGSRLECSSLEDGFFQDRVTQGYGGRDPLDPCVWISRAAEDGDSPQWLMAEFQEVRAITQVTVAWASMAGWSAHFNPGRVRLEATDKMDGQWETLAVFENVEGPVSLWRSESPRPVRQMRLVFERPSRMGLDRRARVALWQAWGPWDGVTPVGP